MEENRNFIIALSTDGQGIIAIGGTGQVSNQIASTHLFLPDKESQGTLTVAMCDGSIVAFNYRATYEEADAEEAAKKVLILSSSTFFTIVDGDNEKCEAVITFESDGPISIVTGEKLSDLTVPIALFSSVGGMYIGFLVERYDERIMSWLRSLW